MPNLREGLGTGASTVLQLQGRRSCPGKDLSWTIVRAFLLELQAVGWRCEAEGPAAEQEGGARVPTTGYAFAAFDIKLDSKNKKEA